MDFDSPDVEKEFPGLYASETTGGRNKKGNDDDDFSDHGDHEKPSKKELLLGRRKEKKDKKDRGYATLDGESSPDEEPEVKSPSKSKKSKAFKFASSKSKEKREKSRDKEQQHNRSMDAKHLEAGDTCNTANSASASSAAAAMGSSNSVTANPSTTAATGASSLSAPAVALGTLHHHAPSLGTLGAQLSGTLHKKDKKDKKEKEKKDKVKDKDKKDKKSKQASLNEAELLELGDAQPIFGVSLGLAVERSRCHDQINLPLVVRDCIDYLQEHGLLSPELYKVDTGKVRLQQLKRLYNNRESSGTDDWDVPTACGLLKLFFKELPEPILTTDLSVRFEEAASLSLVTQQHAELMALVQQLPSYNQTLLAWTLCHFDAVIQHERQNKTNAQNLAVLLSPALQMSHRLLVCMLCHCSTLFEGTELTKYVPPITAASPNLPETSDAIALELRKQDSLLNQIHAEMNAGYVTKKREEQLWEVQRIITQLKRKLRTVEKKPDVQQQQKQQLQRQQQSNLDDTVESADAPTVEPTTSITAVSNTKAVSACSDEDSMPNSTINHNSSPDNAANHTTEDSHSNHNIQSDPSAIATTAETSATAPQTPPLHEQLYVHEESGMLLLPATHPDSPLLLRLQFENVELAKWKANLQERINTARAEIVWLRTALRQRGDDDHLLIGSSAGGLSHNSQQKHSVNKQLQQQQQQQQAQLQHAVLDGLSGEELSGYERIVAHYAQENALLEHKKQLLVREVFEENVELIQMEVDYLMKNFKY